MIVINVIKWGCPLCWRERFKQQCIAANIKTLELVPDVSTRWNSTNDMLERALFLKQVFLILFKI